MSPARRPQHLRGEPSRCSGHQGARVLGLGGPVLLAVRSLATTAPVAALCLAPAVEGAAAMPPNRCLGLRMGTISLRSRADRSKGRHQRPRRRTLLPQQPRPRPKLRSLPRLSPRVRLLPTGARLPSRPCSIPVRMRTCSRLPQSRPRHREQQSGPGRVRWLRPHQVPSLGRSRRQHHHHHSAGRSRSRSRQSMS